MSEGRVLADTVKVALAAYPTSHGHWPKDNAQAGLAAPNVLTGK